MVSKSLIIRSPQILRREQSRKQSLHKLDQYIWIRKEEPTEEQGLNAHPKAIDDRISTVPNPQAKSLRKGEAWSRHIL